MPKPQPQPLLLAALIQALLGSLPAAAQPTAASPDLEYLSDCPGLILSSQQAFGELGLDVAAHQHGIPGAALKIGEHSYVKGLGHHAAGVITVPLDGEYSAFDAEVGLQPCGPDGSVIFRVLVDGQPQFDSGIMRETNAPRSVHVSLLGAQELRLEANDAGDGITCDMANWAEARLARAPGVASHSVPTVDVAPFGRVVTWDPHRMDGARASRIEEFRAEDLFTETDLAREADGSYRVPTSPDGLSCIGLQWLNRRALKRLEIEFASPLSMPPTNAVEVQAWAGESAWQGNWKPLQGELGVSGERLVFVLPPKAGAPQTRKVRWIYRSSDPPRVRALSAFTRSRWDIAKVRVEADSSARRGQGQITAYNGEFIPPPTSWERGITRINWALRCPLSFNVRYSRSSSLQSDPTLLQFHLPAGAVSVAIEDVLSNDCVYLPDYGLFVTRDPVPVTLPEYKRRIAGRKTILQQVRELPDQTLAQAMARTHHDAQREGPVMLSLACDNTKFVLDRDGTLHFPGATNVSGDWFAGAGELRAQTGGDRLTRQLNDGWLPIPVITTHPGGLVWRECVFVAPGDDPGSNPARLNRPSICVAQFIVSNTQPSGAQAALALEFLSNARQRQPAILPGQPRDAFQLGPNGFNAMLVVSKSCPLELRTSGSKAQWTGTLPSGGSALLSICIADPCVDLNLVRPRLNHLRDETADYWTAVLAPAMQVETPDPLLNDLIRSSQVRCLIDARNEADGARIAPWIAAMSYGPLESEANSVIRGMAFMGHEDFARRSLDFFIHRYNTNGFLTTGYTLFGTPWHLWTLSEYFQLYRNTNWLRQAAPEVTRVGDWLIRQTDKTKHPTTASARRSTPAAAAGSATPAHSRHSPAAAVTSPPEYGLMPPGVLADWNAFACHSAMNAYCYAALRDLGTALAALPQSEISSQAPAISEKAPYHTDAKRFLSAADDLRANILRAYRWTQSQAPALPLRDGTWIPHYPSQVHSPGKLADFFPGQDGGRSWCYDVELGAHQLVPTGVFGPRDRETERIMDHMEDVQFLSDGWFDYPASVNEQDWFDLGGFSKVQPYYTRNCEVYALRDDVKPFIRSYFNTLAAMLNPEVLTIWEHFHHSGAWDKTHETGYFLHQTRTMLLTERGTSLWLAPMLTTNWLTNGKRLVVSNAPTQFGPVTYRLESHIAEGLITATIQPPTRHPPREIVLRLPSPDGRPLRSVWSNGKKLSGFTKSTSTIHLKPIRQTMRVDAWYAPPPAFAHPN